MRENGVDNIGARACLQSKQPVHPRTATAPSALGFTVRLHSGCISRFEEKTLLPGIVLHCCKGCMYVVCRRGDLLGTMQKYQGAECFVLGVGVRVGGGRGLG